jgi:HD-GYP domain-containing protein (c-di-GMP phosphodiesterase class II)
MRNRYHGYLAFQVVAALGAAFLLFYSDPSVTTALVNAAVLLSALALIAEAMTIVLSRSLGGSIAFIPYLAAVIVAPSWIALVGVSAVRLLVDRKREPIKALFNVSAHGLTFASTVLVYKVLGGVSLLSLHNHSLLEITRRVGLQSIVAIMFSLALHSFMASGAVAAKTARPARAVWRETYLSTIGVDVLAVPVIFIFAWVYVAFGAIAAVTIWVPILGLRQVQKTNLDLERTNRELLELMVKSIEARDPYTSGHSRRVHHYSLSIARSLKLSEKAIERIGQAALLHDIGKIHEKYAPILRNPGRLSPDEWLIMKEHPIDGADLISTVSGLRELVAPVRGHHERWDGTGYPDGIAGEMIPFESRIIMFADTIDAMTSERPYRSSLDQEQVRAEIIRVRGKQFDPELTDRILAAAVWGVLFPEKQPVRSPGSLTLLGRTDRQGVGA